MNPEPIRVTLRPHLEPGGFHTDRFDAYVGDVRICTHRSGWHTPARELLRRGRPPEALMIVQHDGCEIDRTIVPKPIGEIAKWYIGDSSSRGLERHRWAPQPNDPLATMYPALWTEPSEWPWMPPRSAGVASRTRSEGEKR